MPTVVGKLPTTIVQPFGSQPGTISTAKSAAGFRKVLVNEKDMTNPSALFRVIHELQQNVGNILQLLGGNPMLSGNVVRGLTFTANTALLVKHGLNRGYQGWLCVRAYSAPWLGYETTLPTGVTTSQYVPLINANSGQFDILVF